MCLYENMHIVSVGALKGQRHWIPLGVASQVAVSYLCSGPLQEQYTLLIADHPSSPRATCGCHAITPDIKHCLIIHLR